MMRRLKEILINNIKGISLAGFRFPMTVMSLMAVTTVIFRWIGIDRTLSRKGALSLVA